MMEAVLAAVMAAVTVTAEDIELKKPGVEKISQPFWAGLSLFTPVLKNMDRFGMLSYPRLVLWHGWCCGTGWSERAGVCALPVDRSTERE